MQIARQPAALCQRGAFGCLCPQEGILNRQGCLRMGTRLAELAQKNRQPLAALWLPRPDRWRPLDPVSIAVVGPPGDPAALQGAMAAHRAQRSRSQPLSKRNAGCIFKNPPGQHAGRLIDAAGLKGLRIGDAEVSPDHANFLVNHGHATPEDFAELMQAVRERVRAVHGVDLEPEVEIWSA